MRTRNLAASVAIAAWLAGMPAAVAAAGQPDVLRVWSASYMERRASVTEDEATAAARQFETIIAKSKTFRRYVPAMKAANPNLRLLAYLNGTFADDTEGDAFPADWYVRDPAGVQVRSTRYGNYMMNPAHDGWRRHRAGVCASLLAASGYDGCSLDVLGTAPVTPPFTGASSFVTGKPINPATGEVWTFTEWLSATTGLGQAVKAAVAPRLVYGNGIGEGTRYFATEPSSVLLDGLDGAMAEGFLRRGRDPLSAYPSLTMWRANVDMVADAESRAGVLVAVTKAWGEGTPEEKDAWHSFALASYLLGAGGRTEFAFVYAETSDPAAPHPWWDTPLGLPSGPYFERANGAFQRNFELGRVLVNPSTAAISVKLSADHRTLRGDVVRRVHLPPHSGEVLVRV